MIEGQPYMDEVIVREGGALLRKGSDIWTLCNLHGERTPSFKITSDRTSGHCFGCGWHGDSIDYIRAMHGLSFKEALIYLGINRRQTTEERQAAEKARRERERKAELVQRFREWEQAEVDRVSTLLRASRSMQARARTEAELIALAEAQGEVDELEYRYEVLCCRDDREKFELYREMTGRG